MNPLLLIAETDVWATLEKWLSINVLAIIVIGIPFVYFVSRFVFRLASRGLSPQAALLLRRGVFYAGIFILFVMLLNQLGYTLTALLGAAGIFGIAIGFASQTSLSNIISGIFLISERPFMVGDIIEVGSTRGMVLSIDLLSVKLRTFDNKMVRIPNENLIKAEVTTVTKFPIRRIDIKVGVAYKENIENIRRILLDVAATTPGVLSEPQPLVIFNEFGSSSLDFIFAVWVPTPDFIPMRNTVMQAVKERLDAEGVEIPFPHISIYTGSITDAMPIRIVGQEGLSPAKEPSPPAQGSGKAK